ncbi:hypothetical protein ACFU7Y_33320 [Kitasatospora sp. NPDC057542]|uniref:hypothetical protein n=1 Tax=Kitasatospora sp. NPDC057542 TaxID=3346162 RepID=UPI0036B284D6
MLDHLHPEAATILAALHAAGLTAAVKPADGGGHQIHAPGPYGTYTLIGCPETLPAADEPLTALHAELHDADGIVPDVVFHCCTDPACGQPGCGEGASLDPAALAAALADALNSRRPAYIPNSSRFFNDEGLRYSAYFNPVLHEVTIVQDMRSGISGPFDTDPAATLADAEDVVRGLGYARASEWAGPDGHGGGLYCYLLRPLA